MKKKNKTILNLRNQKKKKGGGECRALSGLFKDSNCE
jgi:hypothetical protein